MDRWVVVVAMFMLLACSNVGAQIDSSGPKDWLGRTKTEAAQQTSSQPVQTDNMTTLQNPTDGTCIPYDLYKKYAQMPGDHWPDHHRTCMPTELVLQFLHDQMVAYRELSAQYQTLSEASERYERASEAAIRALNAIPPMRIVFPPFPDYHPTSNEVNCTSQSLGTLTTMHCDDY